LLGEGRGELGLGRGLGEARGQGGMPRRARSRAQGCGTEGGRKEEGNEGRKKRKEEKKGK
jgi:hypothetical protein